MTGWQYLKQILTKEQMQAVRFAKKAMQLLYLVHRSQQERRQ